jgi:hypothetical protein
MFGLAVLLAMGVYLLLSVGVVKWAIRYARDNGKSAKRWGLDTDHCHTSILLRQRLGLLGL